VCGSPFFEYHHIIPFGEKPHHEPADMMILCPNHHHEANVGAMDDSAQRKSKGNPFNIDKGYVLGQLAVASRTLAVELGANLFIGSGMKVVVDNEPLLQIGMAEERRLALSLDVHAEDDAPLISVVDNEWITGDPLPWDLEFGYRWLKLRLRHHEIALSIDARQEIVRVDGDFWRRGQHFTVSPAELSFNGVDRNIGFTGLGFVAATFIVVTKKREFAIAPDPVFKQMSMVSRPTLPEVLTDGLKSYQSILEKQKPGRNDPCPCRSGEKWKRCHGA